MSFGKIKKNSKQEKKEKADEHRFFINILKPLQDDTKIIDEKTNNFKKPSEHRDNIRYPTPVISLKCNPNDKVDLDKKESRIGYKVLAIKDNSFGRKTLFDLLDGTVYNCSIANKMTKFVPLFDSKSAAMNERCNPYKNDHTGIDESKCPRILASFEGWGKCLRRHGGGSSTIFEFVRFIKIDEFLDPPQTVQARLNDKCAEPFFYNSRDKNHVPNRQRADRSIRVDHLLKR
eukprot:gene26681-35357_t